MKFLTLIIGIIIGLLLGLCMDMAYGDNEELMFKRGAYTKQEQTQSPNCLTFRGNANAEVGKLCWEENKLMFSGDASESAKLFFENIIKHMMKYNEQLCEDNND